MAYTAPTATEFKDRFPIFVDVSDPAIETLIVEAQRQVDESWAEADYKPAIQYWVAHVLVMEGALNPDGAAASAQQSGPIKSESLGDASVTYADRAGSSGGGTSTSEYMQTSYGARFVALRRANVGGPVVA